MSVKRDSRSEQLQLLLRTRQKVRETLDDAFLEGHISLDASSALDHKIDNHFAAAIKQSSSIGSHGKRQRAASPAQNRLSNSYQSTLPDQTSASIAFPTPASLQPSGLCPESSSITQTPISKRRKRLARVEGGYPCNHCEKVFDRAGDRTKHQAVHEPGKRANHACQLCGKAFAYPKDLKRHVSRLHQEASPIVGPDSATCSTADTLVGSDLGESYFPLIEFDDLLAATITADTEIDSTLPTPVSSEELVCVLGRDPDLYTCSCSPSGTCIQESLVLLQGSLGLLILAAEYKDIEWNDYISLANVFRCLEAFIPQVRPNSGTCQELHQCFANNLLEPMELIPTVLHSSHVLLALFDFSDFGFQDLLREMEASQLGNLADTIHQANMQLLQYQVKAHKSQFGATMDELLSVLSKLALAMTWRDFGDVRPVNTPAVPVCMSFET